MQYSTPKGYNFLDHLKEHIGNVNVIFRQQGIFPRQLSIFMPIHSRAGCNYNCYYCCGLLSPKTYGNWEQKGIAFIRELNGAIPYIMITGGCTEPTLNEHFMSFLVAIKESGSYYGVKTNGSLLKQLEDKQSLLMRMCDIADSSNDYISISLDAGNAASHGQTKGISERVFAKVVDGIDLLGDIRGEQEVPALRISYLLNDINDTREEIEAAIQIARDSNFDSIRFSSVHPIYGTNDKEITSARILIEQKHIQYEEMFEDIISNSKPFVFYASPYGQNTNIRFCAYGYYQICLSHDGNFYRCPPGATIELDKLKLGPLTDVPDFMGYLYRNQSKTFSPSVCFKNGLYCCRAAVAINDYIDGILL